MEWTDTLKVAYEVFPSAPPPFPGAPYRPRPLVSPYRGAERWKCSVYYFWWEYLRRHAGYRATCAKGGRGEFANLYRDFGDIHSTDFPTWWWQHLGLFTVVGDVRIAPDPMSAPKELRAGHLIVEIPFARTTAQMARVFRHELEVVMRAGMKTKMLEAIKYVPAARCYLPSLFDHLRVWDAHQQNPMTSPAELAELIELDVVVPFEVSDIDRLRAEGLPVRDLERHNARARRLAVQRHLRIAQQYIDNAALGQFPVRSRR
jgi:hypothetical protein